MVTYFKSVITKEVGFQPTWMIKHQKEENLILILYCNELSSSEPNLRYIHRRYATR